MKLSKEVHNIAPLRTNAVLTKDVSVVIHGAVVTLHQGKQVFIDPNTFYCEVGEYTLEIDRDDYRLFS